jgi:hypothetical protein
LIRRLEKHSICSTIVLKPIAVIEIQMIKRSSGYFQYSQDSIN